MTIVKLPGKPPKDNIKFPNREEVKKILNNYKKQKEKDKSKDKSQQNKIPNKLMDRMRNMPPKKSGAGYSGSY
tara:strand:+ start:821 stop:1039 length:219 start_codon:yes stop_codon:yes gene_type:complete